MVFSRGAKQRLSTGCWKSQEGGYLHLHAPAGLSGEAGELGFRIESEFKPPGEPFDLGEPRNLPGSTF